MSAGDRFSQQYLGEFSPSLLGPTDHHFWAMKKPEVLIPYIRALSASVARELMVGQGMRDHVLEAARTQVCAALRTLEMQGLFPRPRDRDFHNIYELVEFRVDQDTREVHIILDGFLEAVFGRDYWSLFAPIYLSVDWAEEKPKSQDQKLLNDYGRLVETT